MENQKVQKWLKPTFFMMYNFFRCLIIHHLLKMPLELFFSPIGAYVVAEPLKEAQLNRN
jgi:hypothetical protein